MWLKHDDAMVNLSLVSYIDKDFNNSFYEIDFYIFNDYKTFRFDTEAEREEYWDKNIIPLLNK